MATTWQLSISWPFVASVFVVIVGCGRWEIPSDPHHTYEHVNGKVVRVGYTERSPWVVATDDAPAGIEPELVQELADKLSAKIEWYPGSEAELVEGLEQGRLDLVIGGFRQATPWSNRVAVSQHYAYDAQDKIVFLAPQGENRWLLAVDRYLVAKRPEVTARVDQELIQHGDLSRAGVSP